MRRMRFTPILAIHIGIVVTMSAGCVGTHTAPDKMYIQNRNPTIPKSAQLWLSQRSTRDSRYIPVSDKIRRNNGAARGRRKQGVIAGTALPLNDECINAQNAAVPSQVIGYTTDATFDAAPFCQTDNTASGIWYRVIGTGNTMTASMCNEFVEYDAKISVYCSGCETLTCVAGSDDGSCPGLPQIFPEVKWCSILGAEYLILVHGFDTAVGGFTLSIYDDGVTCDGATNCTLPPPHDDCGDCIPVATNQPYNDTTVGATGTDITSCTDTDTADVWHCWQADCTGAVTFSLCNSSFDTSLALFNDCGGQELACNDDSCGTQSEITYNVTAGTTYFIRVAGYLGATGDYLMNISCNTSIGACCDDSTGVCNDRTAEENCPPPMRFAADTLCSEMVPLCGVPLTEACCFPDGPCQDYSHDECLERLGVPQGPDTNCNTTICEPQEACCIFDLTCTGLSQQYCTVSCPCNPDMNCDGELNANDITAFKLALTDPVGYQNTYPVCDVFKADLDCDLGFDELDSVLFDCLLALADPPACIDIDPRSCSASGGSPQGVGTECMNADCQPLGACCVFDSCTGVMTDAVCRESGGTWYEQRDCANFTCPQRTIEHDIFEQTTAMLQLVGGPIGPVPVPYVLRGPTQVDVFFEGPNEGNANDNDGDLLDEVPTELILLQLTDGSITLSLQPSRPSLGEIEEQVNNTPGTLDVQPFTASGAANSFFDVFFQVEVGGLILHNEQSLRLEAVIRHKPPFTQYTHIIPPNGPIELVDANNQPTGIFIVNAQHNTGTLEIDQFPFSIGLMELIHPTSAVETIAMAGEATAHVFFEGGVEGAANDDNGNSRDEVKTEMVSLKLHGTSPSLGDIVVSVHPTLPSLGQIEELLNNNHGLLDVDPFAPGDADSFFDLFFQIDLPGPGLRYFTIHPKHMRSLIDHKPPGPGALYESPDQIQLFDENGEPTGYFIGATRHRPRPSIEVDQFDFSIGQFDLAFPDATIKTIAVSGPATVNVYFEGNEGDANDDNGNTRDEVMTEMVALNLVGHHPDLGVVTINVHPTIASLGEIEELVNNSSGLLDVDPFAPGDANSFFNLFFKVIVGGQTYYTIDPKRMSSRIDEKPPGPGALYEGLVDVQLYDENGNATGIILTATRHRPRPIIEVDQFDFTVGQFELAFPDDSIKTIAVSGPATVNVYFEGTQEGDANDDNGNARDEVMTEMVALNLVGHHPDLGVVTINVHPTIASLGEIEELVNNNSGLLDVDPFAPGDANSFFNLFFKVIVGGQTYYTIDPKRMSSRIAHKPPGSEAVYENFDSVQLYDEKGNATGIFLRASRNRPRPTIEVDQFDLSIGVMELINPSGGIETIAMSGDLTAHVFFEGGEGSATDDNGNGWDEVNTEIVSMNLHGNSPSLGDIIVHTHPTIPSLGEIEELVNNNAGLLDVDPFAPGDANSFFDLFFQIDLPGPGLRFFTINPKRMSSLIDHKPPGPGTVYENPERVDLFDEDGQPTGYFLGKTSNQPTPRCDSGDIDGDGDTDQVDYISFHGCLAGPINGSASSDCLRCFDFDLDNDVDLFDASVFQRFFTGAQ